MGETQEIRACFVCRAEGVQEKKRGGRILFFCPSCGKLNERYFEVSAKTKRKKTPRGWMHFTAGALVKRNGKYLASKRTRYPFLYTTIGGHVDQGETMREALVREVREETGLEIVKMNLLFRGRIDPDLCTRGVDIHYWYLYLVEPKGRLKVNCAESAHLRWMTKKQMARVQWTPPVAYILQNIGFFSRRDI